MGVRPCAEQLRRRAEAMEIRKYYKEHLAHLESPEFVAWFENWYGDESPYGPGHSENLEKYWSERRFALLGWHAALLPVNVAADKRRFVQSLRISAE